MCSGNIAVFSCRASSVVVKQMNWAEKGRRGQPVRSQVASLLIISFNLLVGRDQPQSPLS